MHYYQFNIADYRKDTVHLTRIEHSIYRDLIDWYYLEETPIPKECDHIHPLALGGNNDLLNLTIACQKCNRSKGSKTVSQWMNS